MHNCTVCQEPASSTCSLCKGSEGAGFYCSAACQQKDWRTHKKICCGRKPPAKPQGAPVPPFTVSAEDDQDDQIFPLMFYHPAQSPYGFTMHPDDMTPRTLFYQVRSWSEAYTPSEPYLVYRELIDTFKYHITYNVRKYRADIELSEQGALPMDRALPAFKVFLNRLERKKLAPEWWTEQNRLEVERLAGGEGKPDDAVHKPFEVSGAKYYPRYKKDAIMERFAIMTESVCHVSVEKGSERAASADLLSPAHLGPGEF